MIKWMSWILIVLMNMALSGCNLDTMDGEQKDPKPDDLLVLFVGSSYFGQHNMPGMLEVMAHAANKEVFCDYAIFPGVLLAGLSQHPYVLQKITERPWDYVLFQGGPIDIAYADTNNANALEKLCKAVRDNNPDSKPVYFMNWAFEDGMLWVQGHTETYEDMQIMIRDNTIDIAEQLDMVIAPAGWAWYQILQETKEPHYLHTSDYNHPTWKGSYLSVCVIYVTLFQESVYEVPFVVGMENSEALHFQETATSVVLDEADLWRLPDLSPDLLP